MSDVFGVPAAGTKIFGDLIGRLANATMAGAGKSFKAIIENLRSTFGPHLESTFDRCTKIKTLLNKDEPVELLSQYVNLNFKCGNKSFDDFKVIEEIRKRKRVIISGTAGGGKTIFMKYLWVSFFEKPQGKIPVFIELRKLNEVTADDLIRPSFTRYPVGTNCSIEQKERIFSILTWRYSEKVWSFT